MALVWDPDEIGKLDSREVRAYYFQMLDRRISMRPRALKLADDFQCPAAFEQGWVMLQDKVRRGRDLNPALSKLHSSIFNKDGLLAEWGVHHFHLGQKPDAKNARYVERTKALVFAILDDGAFYSINAYPHSGWEYVQVLESVHRNFPETIRRFRVQGVTAGDWDQDTRRKLRKDNINLATAVADGTVYMPIGGPTTMAGIKMKAMKDADFWLGIVEQLQTGLAAQLDGLIVPLLKERGYHDGDEVEATLKTAGAGKFQFQAYFPQFDALAALNW